VHLAIIAAVFPAIFIGELPDKTMFASLVMATRGRPLSVWIGASAAFLVHVVIAVSIGVGLFKILPHRVVDLLVAVLFAVTAAVAFIAARSGPEEHVAPVPNTDPGRVMVTAFVVIFLAEWGDLTQVLTANLAVRYHSPLSVGVGAVLGLWAVSGLAVVGGHGLLSRLPTRSLRMVTGSALSVLAVVELIAAVR
jgi:putative Ca2+/H+ antiporter (TMEM165/GDT1 family)